MECLPCFESASPGRAKSLSRAHLVRSRPPKIVPLCERQLCQIKYLSTQVIHKAQGLYTAGRNLGHTSSARHVFSVSSPQRIFPCCGVLRALFCWSRTMAGASTTAVCCSALKYLHLQTAVPSVTLSLLQDLGECLCFQDCPAGSPVIMGPSVLAVPRRQHCVCSLVEVSRRSVLQRGLKIIIKDWKC